MKSPFAEIESEKYTYPAPFEEGTALYTDRVDEEVAAASAAELPWVRIRVPRSKGDNDAIADLTQSVITTGNNGDGNTVSSRIARGNQGIFGLLAIEWSFTKDKPTSDDYARLDMWAGTWIDQCLGDVLAKGQAITAKKLPSSSKPPASSRGGSRAAKG